MRPVESGNRDPNTPSDHQRSVDSGRTEEQKARDHDAAPITSEPEGVEGDVVDGARKPRLAGKTLRQRRKLAQATSVPIPPPVPDWFLEHNIKLFVDTVKPNRAAEYAQTLRCVDGDTGHTLFTLPYYEAWAVPGLGPHAATTTEALAEKDGSSSPEQPLEQHYFDHASVAPGKAKPTASKESGGTMALPVSNEPYEQVNQHALLRWAVLQAETGVNAAFSVARHAPSASSRAASRLDLSLSCEDPNAHASMDDFVEDLATISGANLIRLDANDLADLSADYVGQGSDSPGSLSNLAYDVFGGYKSPTTPSARRTEDEDEEPLDEDDMDEEEDEQEDRRSRSGMGNSVPWSLNSIRKRLMSRPYHFAQELDKVGPGDIIVEMGPRYSKPFGQVTSVSSRNDPGYDEARLCSLLDQILDAPKQSRGGSLQRRSSLHTAEAGKEGGIAKSDVSYQALSRMWRSSAGCWLPDIAGLIASLVLRASKPDSPHGSSLILEPSGTDLGNVSANDSTERTIVHVRDLRDIVCSRVGEGIIRRLVSVVQKRRRAGQQIVIVGSSCHQVSNFVLVPQALDDFITISVPAVFRMSKHDQVNFKPTTSAIDNPATPPYSRILEINLRHIQRMLNSLRPGDTVDLFTAPAQRQLRGADDVLSKEVMTFDMIQRIVLTAIGLSEVHAVADHVNASHVGLATTITRQAAQTERDWTEHQRLKETRGPVPDGVTGSEASSTASNKPSTIEKIKKDLDKYESKLLPGVVDAENIKAGFGQVHAPLETIEALKTLTSLSLLRPDAFRYGVLAADRLPGLMLYGPPGTGKTLLAKAVAKESGATVLEISGAQIYEKYVGEGEKMVRAVFSLAKKLSPCIVFIDEADAIFGSRSNAGNRNTHREIINQFLREWDGMDMHNVFIMVASNRPFDLDDAVLRRLPRRLLVDLPVAKDRESILKIHLHDEVLDETVDLPKLAVDTPLYSGSDLKNVCVSAALACVREENELVESKRKEGEEFKLPAKRTLSSRHFEMAVKEISASISEDMGSLTAIRKFDEQYGDRRSRRRKTAYGFGIGPVDVDDARVRQSSTGGASV